MHEILCCNLIFRDKLYVSFESFDTLKTYPQPYLNPPLRQNQVTLDMVEGNLPESHCLRRGEHVCQIFCLNKRRVMPMFGSSITLRRVVSQLW